MMTFDAASFQADFFARAPLAESVMKLFDALPHTYFYAKDRESRFVKVNHPFLENHGLSEEWEAIGKTDRDLHPPIMAEAYIAEDQRVMASGEAIPGQIWPVLHRRQLPRWYVSTKVPLYSATGEVMGLAGAMYRIADPDDLAQFFHELTPVVRYFDQHYAETISMKEMAQLAGQSATHFHRRFRQLLHMNPTEYLRTVRIQNSQHLLATTSRSLADIATAVGFTDQSHFTKRFRQSTGLTPDVYRRRFMQTIASSK